MILENNMDIKNKVKEIGSEFYNCTLIPQKGKNGIYSKVNWEFYLSGRTALYEIIKDVKSKRNVTNVYLPNYVCESMIKPFEDSGIKVGFYDIKVTSKGFEYCLEPNKQIDIILIMNYFGLFNNKYDNDLKKIINNYSNSIIIEDITHNLLSLNDYNAVDYMYGSIRKWDGFYSGGIAYSKEEKTICSQTLIDATKFYATRKNGMDKKKQYIEQDKYIDKRFLKDFERAEELLELDYKHVQMDSLSREMFCNWDENLVRRKRRENYNKLLKGCDVYESIGAYPICIELDNEDVPLFMPLIFENEAQRNKVRKVLIDNKVYCPVHWPIYESIKSIDCISKYELSIPCDQRYDEKNMEYIINVLRDKVR